MNNSPRPHTPRKPNRRLLNRMVEQNGEEDGTKTGGSGDNAHDECAAVEEVVACDHHAGEEHESETYAFADALGEKDLVVLLGLYE